MNPAIDVFARKEKKYVITSDQYRLLLGDIHHLLCADTFGRSIISSLYYDTPEEALINRSLEKPLYKEKLRLRAYGSASYESRVFIELKKKFKGIVYKRRVGCSYAAALAFMEGMPYSQAVLCYPLPDDGEHAESLTPRALQIAAEIEACRLRWNEPKPSMMIVVDRRALRSTDGSDVRITFDVDPVWRNDELDFTAGFDGRRILPHNEAIMEIKSLNSYPLWLSHALSEHRIFPQSCSKYGRAYAESHTERTSCA